MARRWFSRNVAGKKAGRRDRQFRSLKSEVLESRLVMSANMLLTGPGAGGGPHVRAYESPTMSQGPDFFAYSSAFTGGVHVASGDVNGDGHPDMITGTGAGGGPHVRIFDGHSGQLINQFFAFEGNFTGGINVAAGDINADGKAEIFVGAEGPNSGGRVRVFHGTTGVLLHDIVGPGGSFSGGVRVAAGDFTGDGRDDLVMAAGPGNAPRVMVQDFSTGQTPVDLLAYSPGFTGGVYVAAGDVSGDGRADLITGADAGGGPHVRVFDGVTRQEIRSFFAYNSGFTGGVRLATTDFNNDGLVDIVTAAGAGGGPHVRVFSGGDLSELHGFFAYDPAFTGGVFPGGNLHLGPGGVIPPNPTNPSNPIPGPGTGSGVDLAGDQLKIVDQGRWGDKIMALASIRNNGSVASGGFHVQWYLSTDPQGTSDDILLVQPDSGIATYSHAPIAANSAGTPFTVLLQLPAAPPPGFVLSDMHIVMRTDALSRVPEANEGNNFGEVGEGKDRQRINVTAHPPRNLGFKIDVHFPVSGLTASQRAIFQFAADRWSSVIAGDLPDVGFTIDDLQITALGVFLDGPGDPATGLNLLGSAGPTAFRPGAGGLPYQGLMQFDTFDLAQLEATGELFSVILHEMGHVLGIGTMWSPALVSGAGTFDPRFRGAFATAEYNRIFNVNESSVPIESFEFFGAGSAEGHWRESVFGSELMTPLIGPGFSVPMSSVTVASLADLGYQVIMANADPFTPTPATNFPFLQAPASSTGGSGIVTRPAIVNPMAASVLVPLSQGALPSMPVDQTIEQVRSSQAGAVLAAAAAYGTASSAADLVFAAEEFDANEDPTLLDLLHTEFSSPNEEILSAALAE